jgi:TonB family protein
MHVNFTNVLSNLTATCALVLPLAAQAPVSEVVKSNDGAAVVSRAKAAIESGAYADAQQLYERALELARQAYGENSATYAQALVDVARAYQADMRRSGQAIQYYQKALPVQEATLGPNHPDVATTQYFLALDLQTRKQNARAKQMYERALDIRSKVFGSSDPRVAEILTPLAVLTGDEAQYQKALAIFDANNRDSSQTATALEQYGKFLTEHQRRGEAESMQTRAGEIRKARVAEIGAQSGPVVRQNVMRVNAAAGVTAPSVKSKIEPEYSDIARMEKYQGTVVLMMVVGTDGLAHDIQLKKGIGMGLDEKAAEALGKWTFNPGTKDGQPVDVAATVEVNFRVL